MGAPERVWQFHEHNLRGVLAGEIHARPYQRLPSPVRVSHIAVLHEDLSAADERAYIAALFQPYGVEAPGEGAEHVARDLGAFLFRWERHREFSTYTFSRGDAFEVPFQSTALSLVPVDWLDRMTGEVIAAIHICVDKTVRTQDELGLLFNHHPLVGSKVVGGAAEAWSDLHLYPDGFLRIMVYDESLTDGQVGRLIQRLSEIETYRMMALLAFPDARYANGQTVGMDRELAGIVQELADPNTDHNDRELLERLTALAAMAEKLDATTNFRLSATKAYYDIVRQRIVELREDRISGVQTLSEFMERRLAPAMKTCEAAARKQDQLSRRVGRAGDLLRTRVDIAMEEKNRDLLDSMNRRALMQFRLQRTVEGLSIAAISYYVLGLVAYAAKGMKSWGLPIDTDIAVMLALPVILMVAFLGLQRLHKSLAKDGDDEG